jgi:hypothetical protein
VRNVKARVKRKRSGRREKREGRRKKEEGRREKGEETLPVPPSKQTSK